ncbi:BaiN/RdsA family NAD(P)/FAD-dependent oxidoreductase [Proteocatella sphenisci]|uniref:NAD(P)/FAD-dependent oxidoreductase n=1 Tax=Proteocatella sphenisci TaxID=181070 RepID=UPI000491D50D|nr:aminoacetone oxidase family FAD-binding enzyme [Proteocatella sphenisci]
MIDYDIVVIGSGPAGIMAALEAAKMNKNNKLKVAIIERNSSIGKKFLITGGGRCNITSTKDISDFYNNITRNPKFLYSSFAAFNNQDLISFFNRGAIEFKIEGEKYYPKNDNSKELLDFLLNEINEAGIDLLLGVQLIKINPVQIDNKEMYELFLNENNSTLKLSTKKLILASGGASYKSTGSDGSVFEIIQELGINVVPLKPTLVRLMSNQSAITQSQGISLTDVKFTTFFNNKKISELNDGVVFTHNGISGPGAINSSSFITDKPLADIKVFIDFLPHLSREELMIIVKSNDKQKLITRISKFLPKEMVKNILHYEVLNKKSFEKFKESELFPDSEILNMKKNQINDIIDGFKNFELRLTGYGGLNESIVTRGGIDIKEINSKTLNLKKYPGIYAAGEMIDVDAFTGGYNLQIAFSTGHLCGKSARASLKNQGENENG